MTRPSRRLLFSEGKGFCSRCYAIKPLEEMEKCGKTLPNRCKPCAVAHHRELLMNNRDFYERHKRRTQEWYWRNREKALQYGREWYQRKKAKEAPSCAP